MANVNINRTTTDTNDNVRYSYNAHGKMDYKGITILIIGILVALTIIWLIALIAAAIGCWYTEVYECRETRWVFWGYIGVLSSFVFAGLAYAVVHLWNLYFNEQYLEWRGVITHRNDLRGFTTPEFVYDKEDKLKATKHKFYNTVANVLQVANTSASSERSAGMDNYSPSVTENKNSILKGGDIEIKNPLDIDPPLKELNVEQASLSEAGISTGNEETS